MQMLIDTECRAGQRTVRSTKECVFFALSYGVKSMAGGSLSSRWRLALLLKMVLNLRSAESSFILITI